MRSLTLTGALLMGMLLTGCGTEDSPTAPLTPNLAVEDAGHNTADHSTVVEVISVELENPCNGELITFTGKSFYQVTSVGPLDGTVHSEFHSVIRATGTGSESGAGYTINDIYHEGFNSPSPPAPQVNYMERNSFHATSDLPGLSFYGYFAFHFVALPSGEFKVTRDVESVTECRG